MALPRYRVIQLQIAGIVLSIAAVAALFAVVLTRDSGMSDREYEQATTCPGLADTRQTTTDPDESLRAIDLWTELDCDEWVKSGDDDGERSQRDPPTVAEECESNALQAIEAQVGYLLDRDESGMQAVLDEMAATYPLDSPTFKAFYDGTGAVASKFAGGGEDKAEMLSAAEPIVRDRCANA